mmetsp:Transcript_9915/g.15663  ORF Transcript_9915/g.15663 Transcript_9915/m.15663 type:complete len:120 (-) Transcript_9915:834-1193(-)
MIIKKKTKGTQKKKPRLPSWSSKQSRPLFRKSPNDSPLGRATATLVGRCIGRAPRRPLGLLIPSSPAPPAPPGRLAGLAALLITLGASPTGLGKLPTLLIGVSGRNFCLGRGVASLAKH